MSHFPFDLLTRSTPPFSPSLREMNWRPSPFFPSKRFSHFHAQIALDGAIEAQFGRSTRGRQHTWSCSFRPLHSRPSLETSWGKGTSSLSFLGRKRKRIFADRGRGKGKRGEGGGPTQKSTQKATTTFRAEEKRRRDGI